MHARRWRRRVLVLANLKGAPRAAQTTTWGAVAFDDAIVMDVEHGQLPRAQQAVAVNGWYFDQAALDQSLAVPKAAYAHDNDGGHHPLKLPRLDPERADANPLTSSRELLRMQWSAYRGWGRCLRYSLNSRMLRLSLASVLLPVGSIVAQASRDSLRLTVRPRTMAAAMRNPPAGEYPLDSIANAVVTMPPQCAGAMRCPLVVQLPGAGYSGGMVTKLLGRVANQYGFILLASAEPAAYDARLLDASLREVFRRFAVEPDKIAIMGRSKSGRRAMAYGIHNLDLFSRIGSVSGGTTAAGMDPRNTTAEFFIDSGFMEFDGNLTTTRQLQRAGHRVKLVVGFRGHEYQQEDDDLLGRWLQESWTIPSRAARSVPQVVAVPLPRLTIDALRRMATFWQQFLREPGSIQTAARRAHLREVVVPVGDAQPSVLMTDMAALAAAYPSVAADLHRAGLTAQQHEAYRLALLSARTTGFLGREAGTVAVTSVLAQNIRFIAAHPDEFDALDATTDMWLTP